MKKIISPMFLTLILFGCSENNETLIEPNDSTLTTEQTQKELSLTTNEALTIAEDLIEEVYDRESNFYIAEEEEILDQRMDEIKPYVTSQFYDSNIALFDCGIHPKCKPSPVIPNLLMHGLRPEISALTDNSFSVSALYPVFYASEGESYQSYRQTVTIVDEDGQWKVHRFENTDEDINLQEEEFLTLLEIHGSFQKPETFDYVDSIYLDGQEEEAYSFYDTELENTFYLLPRIGHIQVDSINNTNETTANLEVDDLYEMLSNANSVFQKNLIDTSSEEVQSFIAREEELDMHFGPPYTEADREYVNWLHSSYVSLLSDVYDYYVQFYDTTDGVNEFEQYFASWNWNREQYFELQDVHYVNFDDADISFITTDIYFIQYFIYDIMVGESI